MLLLPPHARSVPALTLPLLLAACASTPGLPTLGPSAGPEVPWDVPVVVRASVEVLENHGIPVAAADDFEGVVESGVFQVYQQWGRLRVQDIVTCPVVDSPRPADVFARPFRVQVVVNATPSPGGSTRIAVGGTAEGAAVTGPATDRLECRLSQRFRDLLADEIRREAMNLPRRPAGPRDG